MARQKRANGAGQLYTKHGSYYGRWITADGGRSNRKLGGVRMPGASSGLTRRQAERRLQELMLAPPVVSRPDWTIPVVGRLLLGQLEAKGRAPSHIESVESHLRVHLVPYFGDRTLDRIGDDEISRFLVALRRKGLAPKTIRNVASTLHSLFALAIRKHWVTENPCTLVELPATKANADIRYLTQDELAAVLTKGIPAGSLRQVETVLYLMAAMTRLRQGELLGLRWRDLDFDARKVRVRQAYVRGQFKDPKSVRGSRGVPLAQEVVELLNTLYARSLFVEDDDLVFAHPELGSPLDRSRVHKRFQQASRRAGVRTVRFHDLRHTFGTRVAASGEVSLRTLQEWMGHRDPKTTLIYADYQPGEREAEIVSRAFSGGRR